jgi:hypothetical protein
VSNEISHSLQKIIWNLPHSATSHFPGKLSLCIGMPVIIRNNDATELCITMGNILCNKSSDWHLREISKFSDIFLTMVPVWWHLRLLSFHWQLLFADNLVWFQFQRQHIFVTTKDELALCIGPSWFMWQCIMSTNRCSWRILSQIHYSFVDECWQSQQTVANSVRGLPILFNSCLPTPILADSLLSLSGSPESSESFRSPRTIPYPSGLASSCLEAYYYTLPSHAISAYMFSCISGKVSLEYSLWILPC